MKVELFKFDSCPFCVMVMDFIESNQLAVELKDIQRDPSLLDFHIQKTGRRTVPCLYIDGEPMFESRDIINWLATNKDNISR